MTIQSKTDPVKLVAAVAGYMLLAACQTSPNGADIKSSSTVASKADGATTPADRLQEGECGLFLWATGGTERPLVFYRRSGDDSAEIRMGAVRTVLPVTREESAVVPSFFLIQEFEASAQSQINGQGLGVKAVRLKLKAEDSRNLVAGIKVPSGVMTYTGQMGQIMTPVSGLFACKINQSTQ